VSFSNNKDKLHELIGEYMSKLATLVEHSSSRESKPAAIWKHRNFLSSISHQVKTPLSAIFSGTKLIKHYINDDRIDRICEYMIQSCVELTRYMNDIIDFYYLKQGVLTLDTNRVSIKDTLDYVYNNYKLEMQDAEIQFSTQITHDVPDIIYCDDLRLTQILMNLVDNAVKFTCHPGNDKSIDGNTDTKIIGIYVSLEEIYLEDKSCQEIVIQVADTGVGSIDLENQEVYFQPFTQTSKNWLNAPDGIGLGLCLSRDFAKLMGGTLKFINPISATNTAHFHTCIELRIPLKTLNTQLVNIQSDKTLINTYSTQNKPPEKLVVIQNTLSTHIVPNQIILIDDNQTNLELLRLILEQLGQQPSNIISFTNSLQGEKYIRDNYKNISHVIVDIRMPRKNGLDLISELAPAFPCINYILLTALNHDDVRSRHLEIKHNNPNTTISLLFKPIDCEELKKLLGKPNPEGKNNKSKSTVQRQVSTV
jgi:signal transduction histidine kinase/CheY-like chemotaxis protein